jgi:hypothetical protein
MANLLNLMAELMTVVTTTIDNLSRPDKAMRSRVPRLRGGPSADDADLEAPRASIVEQ